MPRTGLLTAAECERIFHAALGGGDTRGVEAALLCLAVRDPHRAQELLDITKAALAVADAVDAGRCGGVTRDDLAAWTNGEQHA